MIAMIDFVVWVPHVLQSHYFACAKDIVLYDGCNIHGLHGRCNLNQSKSCIPLEFGTLHPKIS